MRHLPVHDPGKKTVLLEQIVWATVAVNDHRAAKFPIFLTEQPGIAALVQRRRFNPDLPPPCAIADHPLQKSGAHIAATLTRADFDGVEPADSGGEGYPEMLIQ